MSEAADTLQSQAFLVLLDLLGEGPIGGLVNGEQSIYFNETPLRNADGTYNFRGVNTDFVNGTNTQSGTDIDLSKYAETSYNVNVQVKKNQPYTFAVSNPNTTAVRVLINIPGLSAQNSSTGDITGTSVQYRFEISYNGGPFEGVKFQTSDVVTVTGKTRSKYQRSHVIKVLDASNCLIRVIRVTNDSTTAYLQNDTYVDSYYEIISNNLIYPNSALVGIQIDSKQFSSIPNRAYEVYGLQVKVPSNYQAGGYYNGTWDGTFKTEWTNNPAWVLYDLLTNKRYGLGNFITPDMVDKVMLYNIGRYCDERITDGFGGSEQRFSINTVIASQADAYKVISDITSVFRGMAYWNGGMVSFTQDSPEDPMMVYSPANVVDGQFNYTGSARKDRHSVVHVTYNDKTDFFRKKIEYVEDPDLVQQYGIKKLDTLAFGTVTRAQAARVGRWILYTEKYESDFITFKVGLDSAFVVPGNIIKIQDPSRAGKRSAGRLIACTTTSATLDNPILLSSVPATISLAMPDGSFVDRTLNQAVGEHTTVTWTTPLSELPVDDAMWLIAEPSLVPVLARVVAVAQGENPGQFEITAVEHNPSKFDAIENNLELEDRPTSILDASYVATPSDVQVIETAYLATNNSIATKLLVSWFGNSTKYEVTYRALTGDSAGNEVTTLVSGSLTYEVLNVTPGNYEISLTGINPFGKRSTTVTVQHTVLGKTTLPSNVTSMTATLTQQGAQLSWTPVSDVDVMTYEIRKSSTVGGTWEDATFLVRTATPLLSVSTLSIGEQEWQVKAVDTSGGLSGTAARASLTVSQIPALQNVAVTSGFLSFYVQYDVPSRVDFAGVRVYLSQQENFTPSELNLVYSGPNSLVTINRTAQGAALVAGATYYVKVAGYSRYGTDSLNFSSQFTVTPLTSTQVATVALYQWASVEPSSPNGTSTFNWSTGEHYNYTGTNYWATSIPTNPGTPGLTLWQAVKQVSASAADTTTSVSWTSGFTTSAVSTNGNNGTDGADAQFLALTSTAQSFTFDSGGTASPANQVISFNANLINATGSVTFTATRYDSSNTIIDTIAMGGSGNVRTITSTQFGAAAYCVVSATLGTLSDTVTIVRLKDGTNAVTGLLTNEAATLAADASGTVSSYAAGNGTFKVFDGLSDVTGSAVTYSVVSSSGLTITIASTGAYTLSAMSQNTGTATLRAVYKGVTIDKVYSAAKSLAGAAGATGATGPAGAAGADGVQSTQVRLYQWAATIPAAPTGTGTYTWATNSATYTGGGGWTSSAGTSASAGFTLWVATVNLTDSAKNATTSINWGTAAITATGYAGTNGSAALLLALSSSAQAFTFDSAGTASPSSQTITFTATLQNTSGTATFTAIPYNSSGTAGSAITLGGTGNTRTLSVAQFGTAKYVIVTATLNSLTDTLTIVRLQDGATGAAGANGQNAVVGYLTNEAYTVAADSSGTVASYANAGGTFKVFDGLTDKTGASVTYSLVSSSGVTISIASTGVYTVTAMSADTGTAVLRAVYGGLTIDKQYSISKSKSGANGANGTSGAQGASYRTAYARIPNNPTPTSASITTTGNASFPVSGSWGLTATWAANDPNPSSTDTLYQADGIYDPATGNTVWSTPYQASLKVGSISAISANLGSINSGTITFTDPTNPNNYIIIDGANQNIRVYYNATLRVKIGNLA